MKHQQPPHNHQLHRAFDRRFFRDALPSLLILCIGTITFLELHFFGHPSHRAFFFLIFALIGFLSFANKVVGALKTTRKRTFAQNVLMEPLAIEDVSDDEVSKENSTDNKIRTHLIIESPDCEPTQICMPENRKQESPWSIDGATVISANGIRLDLAYPIHESAEYDEILVVLLYNPPKHQMPENVFGISKEGAIIWQIEHRPDITNDPEDCYTGLLTLKKHKLHLYNWGGLAVEIDITNGKILSSCITK